MATDGRQSFEDDSMRSRETEPLLNAGAGSAAIHDGSSLSEDAHQEREETLSTTYLFLLTIAIGGLQIAWSVELGNISPFLISLGLSKSLLAIVWIAGPLGGTIVPPYVGLRSDNCRIRWGRRRPFMIGGTIATVLALLALAWTQEIVHGFISVFGIHASSRATSITTQVVAVVFVYISNFSINIIQAMMRAFFVDCAPTHQQEDAMAWANRVVGFGNITGYLFGFINLTKTFPWLGDTQFKVLVAVAGFIMVVTLAITCISIKERDPSYFGPPPQSKQAGVFSFFKAMVRSSRRLPPRIKQVCLVQIFAWIGWFPFLFYTSTYVSGIYSDREFQKHPDMSKDESDKVWERGTRRGNFALFVMAIVNFIASIVLPLIIDSAFTPKRHDGEIDQQPGVGGSSRQSQDGRISRFLRLLQIPHLTLPRAWLLSLVFFAVLMWSTLFARDTTSATVIIALVGIPWAMTNWAPHALIASEVSKRDDAARGGKRSSISSAAPLLVARTDDDDEAAVANPQAGGQDLQRDQAGVILGIHNIAIAAPQLVATLISSAVFKALQKPWGTTGDDSVGWVLRFGGVCALIAAWVCRKVGDET